MKKITLRTKITVTIAGLLALAGVFYADTPIPFATVPVVFDSGNAGNGPVGVAATKTDLIVTEYCTQNVDMIDCMGNVSPFATIPTGPVGPCSEKYVAIVPAQSASATPAPFTPRDIFVTQGDEVYKVPQGGGTGTLFATITGCAGDDPHTGITFDHVGTFGYNMILTCETGGVWVIDGNGNSLTGNVPFANTGTRSEGPAVVPAAFGPHGGEIWAAAENMDQVNSIDNHGNVTYGVLTENWLGAEAVHVIPSTLCNFCSGGSFFQALIDSQAIYQSLLDDFKGYEGNVLVTSEYGAGTALVTTDGTTYSITPFDNLSAVLEGSAWADCDVPPVPTPTPTPSPSPSPSPTATATATATATPTPTPMPCVLTQGYWKNHPAAWCVQTILLGCQTYSQQAAILIMQNATAGDMTNALAQQLIAAKLDVNCAGGDSSCVASAIANADAWLCQHPVGSNVQAKSAAWAAITHDYNVLCSYNQGQLCAPHCGL